jgi:hypothetical protein
MSITMVHQQLKQQGFAVTAPLYTHTEVAALLHCIESAPATSPSFRRSQDVFAIRNLLGEIPQLWSLLDTRELRRTVSKWLPPY